MHACIVKLYVLTIASIGSGTSYTATLEKCNVVELCVSLLVSFVTRETGSKMIAMDASDQESSIARCKQAMLTKLSYHIWYALLQLLRLILV